jgi:hypothetical protein
MLANLKLNSVYASLIVFLASDSAFAQAVSGTSNTEFQLIIKNSIFQKSVTIGFILLAAYKWFEYFEGFSTGNALTKAITPAILTFIALQWQTVLGWFGI